MTPHEPVRYDHFSATEAVVANRVVELLGRNVLEQETGQVEGLDLVGGLIDHVAVGLRVEDHAEPLRTGPGLSAIGDRITRSGAAWPIPANLPSVPARTRTVRPRAKPAALTTPGVLADVAER